jgi:hypothetical protein
MEKERMHYLDAPERPREKSRLSQVVPCASVPLLIAAAIVLAAPSASNAEEGLMTKKQCFDKCFREESRSWISTNETVRQCRNVCNMPW